MFRQILWMILIIFALSTVIIAQDENGILFEDNFESDNLSQWDYDNALSIEFIEDDNNTFISLSTEQDWGNISSQIGTDWENYSFSFRFRMIDFDTNSPTPHLFINSRSSNEGSYSAFVTMRDSGNVLSFGGQLDGEFGALDIQSLDFGTQATIEANVWHSFEVIVNANVIELYFDHTLVQRLGENELTRGNIGFGLSPNVTVHIDDVTVSTVRNIETVVLPTVVPTTEIRIEETSVCDISPILAESSPQLLLGTLQSGINMRDEPNTQSSIVTFINQGEIVDILDIEPLGEYTRVGNLNGSTVWARVALQRDNDNREGYIWANVLEILDNGDGFSNPLDECFDVNLPDGFAEAISAEFGDTWDNFINCNDVYFASCSFPAVLDGEYITTPIPLYDTSGELIGTSHISMRAFYLDAFGELQHVILPVYFESATGEAFDLAPGTLLPPIIDTAFTPEAMLNIYNQQYGDMLGHVTCIGITKDIDAWIRHYQIEQDETQFLELITTYGVTNETEIDQFIIAGNPQIGVILSDNAIFNTCIADNDGSGSIEIDN